MIKNEPYDLQKDVDLIKQLWVDERLGPSTGSIVEEAVRRGIPCMRLDDNSLVQLGYGANQRRIEATITSTTSSIAVELVSDKDATKKLLREFNIPVPEGVVVFAEDELRTAVDQLGYPLVIKPRDGNQGKGVTTNINNWNDCMCAYKAAKQFSSGVLCERYLAGNDFRALVINYKLVAAARRSPASVTGDGRHTIQHLIEAVNKDPKRGAGHENVMTKIRVDEGILQLLLQKGYTPGTILPEGEECFLKTTANLSTGGTATDVTELVHPNNVSLFNRIARLVGLDICGIDVVAKDLSVPLSKNGGAIIEVNAAPGFRMHLQPSHGTARNVAAPVVDMLFPPGKNARVPIIAVSGTNGKTTTTRLIAHMCMQQGLTTGYTTTEGIYIQEEQLMEGDCAGPVSAKFVLKDPGVEIAVLECARGGILRRGLGFDRCEIAVITNVAEDHLGLAGIDSIEKLARVKAVVAETVKPDGYAILNADDDLVYEIKNRLSCKVALFSLDPENERVERHCQNNGVAAVYSGNYINILHGRKVFRVEHVNKIPLTYEGRAEFNIANVLGSVLAGYLSNFSIDSIRRALASFVPSPRFNPGRMNLFNFNDFTVLVDYAHNPHGMRALGKFVKSVNAKTKVGIIAGVGDRRNEDLIALGQEAKKIFDEIIVRMDDHLRGRAMKEIYDLVRKGIQLENENKKTDLIPDELEAITALLSRATPGSFLVVLTDKVGEAIQTVDKFLDKEEKEKSKQFNRTAATQSS